MKTLRNLSVAVATVAALGIGAASAQQTAKPAAKPAENEKPAAKTESSHRHARNHGDHGCHEGGERHGAGHQKEDEKHEHTPR